MSDSETEHIIRLQNALAEKLQELGFAESPDAREIPAHLAEVVARSRTLEEHALPLFLSLRVEQQRPTAELVVGIKAQLDAIQDAITDVQPALVALADFLLRDTP